MKAKCGLKRPRTGELEPMLPKQELKPSDDIEKLILEMPSPAVPASISIELALQKLEEKVDKLLESSKWLVELRSSQLET